MAQQNYRFFFSICLTLDTTWLLQYVSCLKQSSYVSSSIISAWFHCCSRVFLLLKTLCTKWPLPRHFVNLRRAQKTSCCRETFWCCLPHIVCCKWRMASFWSTRSTFSTKKWDIRAKGKNKLISNIQIIIIWLIDICNWAIQNMFYVLLLVYIGFLIQKYTIF